MSGREGHRIFSDIDWLMVGVYILLVLIGWTNIYAAAFNEEFPNIFTLSQEYGKQFIWILASLLAAFFILLIDPKFFSTFAYFIFGFTMLMLVAVLLFGTEVNGSRSWIYLSENVRIQPLEFAKFSTALALAKYLGDISIRIQDVRTRLVVGVLLALPIGLIFLQNETGSVLVFIAFVFVLYREGLSGNVLIILLLTVLLFLATLLVNKFLIAGVITLLAVLVFFLIRRTRKNILTYAMIYITVIAFIFSVDYIYGHVLQPHQKKRIDVLIGKETDLRGAGYNVNQSKIAIGSGGLLGKGFLNGTQTKFKFVPEQNTDFIFCTIGEEWGFAGSLAVIGLYIILLARILYVADRQRSAFARIYGYGLASILFFHVIINIGMTIGLAPVVGIPLPFISYGGSSLLAFTIMLFVFIRQDAHRKMLL
jgi:rod shape determining protein RodA